MEFLDPKTSNQICSIPKYLDVTGYQPAIFPLMPDNRHTSMGGWDRDAQGDHERKPERCQFDPKGLVRYISCWVDVFCNKSKPVEGSTQLPEHGLSIVSIHMFAY